MPSIRSIGRTDSRMIASAFSTSFIRSADMRASGDSMLCASFIMRIASASISARTRIAIDWILSASASASACARIAAPRSALASFSACAALVRRSASRSAAWRGADQLDRLLALGHLDLARGEHLLLGGHRVGARRVGRGLRLALRLALLARPRSRAAARPARATCGARSRRPGSRAPCRSAPARSSARSGCAPRRSSAWRRSARSRRPARAARARSSPRRAGARARSRPRAAASGARTRLRGRSRARASRPRGSCCGSRSACPARRRCAASCGARSVSVRRVRPSASKALLGLKNSMPVWSSCVSEAASSSRPFLVRSSATVSRTRWT